MACAIASPFYIRNWILLGSPIYPPSPAGAIGFLHAKYFQPNGLTAFYAAEIYRGAGRGRSLLQFLLLPFNLTYHTADFNGAGGIGLTLLAFAPLGLIAARVVSSRVGSPALLL